MNFGLADINRNSRMMSNESKDHAQGKDHADIGELKQLIGIVEDAILPWIQSAFKEGSKLQEAAYQPAEMRRLLQLNCPEEAGGAALLKSSIDKVLQYSINTWHPGFMDKLYASTNPIGVASDLLMSALNTNSHVYHVSPALTMIEKRVSHELAALFGFTGPFAGGITFPGGSYSNIHSLVIARNTLYPDTKTSGNGGHAFSIFTSEHGHYSVQKAAELCGLGSNAVKKVHVDKEGRIIPQELESAISQSIQRGETPLYINSTMGTTVLGSFDPFEEISTISKQHRMWHHIDGSWGGTVAFSETQRHRLKGCHLADSLTINPHKMAGVPVTCSFLLAPDARLFQKANSLRAEYLFHGFEGEEEEYDLADYTMGCGRRSDALKLYLAWVYQGRRGLAERVDHAYKITAYFANKVSSHPDLQLVSTNPPPCCQTCFYYSPNGKLSVDANENTKRTENIANALNGGGRFLVDFAPGPYGDGNMFRAVVVSPKVNETTIDELIENILRIGVHLGTRK